MAKPNPARARIVSQATIIFSLIRDDHGQTMQITSFASPDMPSKDAEELADAVAHLAAAVIKGDLVVPDDTEGGTP